MREGELVREVEDQSAVDELLREVEDQEAEQCEPCEPGKQQQRRYLCWICDNRPFNARHQLVDHIEGAGVGGKSHLKMRKRWIDAGQLPRQDWLEFLEQEKMVATLQPPMQHPPIQMSRMLQPRSSQQDGRTRH